MAMVASEDAVAVAAKTVDDSRFMLIGCGARGAARTSVASRGEEFKKNGAFFAFFFALCSSAAGQIHACPARPSSMARFSSGARSNCDVWRECPEVAFFSFSNFEFSISDFRMYE